MTTTTNGVDRDNGGGHFTDAHGVRVAAATAFRLMPVAGGSIELVTTKGKPTVLMFVGSSPLERAICLDLTLGEVCQLMAALEDEARRIGLPAPR